MSCAPQNSVELLMDVSASLADLTQTLALCRQIPAYLSQALAVESLTLAIIADPTREHLQPEILVQASSGELADPMANAHLTQTLLALFQQTKPLSHLDGPAMRHDVESAHQTMGDATVFARSLDVRHRMLLLVHHTAAAPALSDSLSTMLPMIADQLAKLLACLTAWHGRTEEVVGPFDRLTQREWAVLHGLTSEAGEKQLADQLSLSPHTLHSHIKSIYRKTGEQGRLQLLTKAQSAMRTHRATPLNRAEKVTKATGPAATVAVG